MLRLLEKIVQFQLLQDIPTSKMYLTGTDPTVFQNLRKSVIVLSRKIITGLMQRKLITDDRVGLVNQIISTTDGVVLIW